jgi:hypothetical protein
MKLVAVFRHKQANYTKSYAVYRLEKHPLQQNGIKQFYGMSFEAGKKYGGPQNNNEEIIIKLKPYPQMRFRNSKNHYELRYRAEHGQRYEKYFYAASLYAFTAVKRNGRHQVKWYGESGRAEDK